MSIDFGKFKKNPEVEQDIVEEKVADIVSDKLEKSDNREQYKVHLEYLRTIHGILTGKTNHKANRKRLKNILINLLKKLD